MFRGKSMHARHLLPFVLLAGCAAMPPAEMGQTPPSPAAAPATDTAAEDARLIAFLDQAFDDQIALSPESQTALGMKTDYGKLDDYTEAADIAQRDLAERQLAEMKAQFALDRLGQSARISYQLFEQQVERGRRNFQFRDYGYPVSTNGSPAVDIPVFLINQHRVDTVADAEAYISRIRETERVMREVAAQMRKQAAMGISTSTLR